MKRTISWVVAALLAAQLAQATTTGVQGENYIAECRAAGVPRPPDWPSSKWISNGFLDKGLNPHDPNSPHVFAVRQDAAEVYYYDSRVDPATEPPGVCVGLPRFLLAVPRTKPTDPIIPSNTIQFFGIICQGQTGNACFWDNKENGANFQFQRTDPVPIAKPVGAPGKTFVGGTDLALSTEMCTSCHAGENAFIIHPENRGADRTALALADRVSIQTDTGWYNPIVPAGWPENPGPGTQLDGVASAKSCTNCHKFPQVSNKLAGYCDEELEAALLYTMPAFQNPSLIFKPAVPDVNNPTIVDPDYAPHVEALRAACDAPPVEEMIMIMD